MAGGGVDSGFDMTGLNQLPASGPVTMLNLLKFRNRARDGNGTGRREYMKYANAAQQLVESRGGRVLWAGIIDGVALNEQGDVDWDWALLVYYPSRDAFVDLVTSPDYQRANAHRLNGTERHIILATRTVVSAPMPDSEGA
ncbi:MAG: DUF1330 domain-containing protein [Maioricimonas sp. JB049]